MRHTIRWRIALPYMILMMVLLGGLSIYLSGQIRVGVMNAMEKTLSQHARVTASEAANLFAGGASSQAVDDLAHRYAALLEARVTIIDKNGVVLGDSEATAGTMQNHLSRPEVQQALQGQVATQVRFSDTLKQSMMYVAAPVMVGDSVVGVARVALPTTAVEANQRGLNRVLLLATVVAILLAVVLAGVVSNMTVRPLKHLTTLAEQISRGDFHLPPISRHKNEIGQLEEAFAQMGKQLSSQFGAVQSERAKLNAVLMYMNDGVVIADADGKVQLINPAAERLFNVQESRALKYDVVEALRHYQIVELWQKCQETGEMQSITFEVGPEHTFLQAIASSLGDALPGSTLLLFQDLTRMRRLEIVRRDFVSNVSHELRTPLASLRALNETLQEGALEDPPAARQFLNRMETEIDTMTQMVQELLELSRIESGRAPLQVQPVKPCELVGKVLERISPQAERANLALRMDCPEDLPEVLGDTERLGQVLMNLLHNAVKFTPPGGEVSVSAHVEGDQVVFNVHDTGVGISEEDLDRIFERFYKADRARAGGGTGLGLSIAKHIVESLHGRIWADSELGAGSTFTFTLPIAR